LVNSQTVGQVVVVMRQQVLQFTELTQNTVVVVVEVELRLHPFMVAGVVQYMEVAEEVLVVVGQQFITNQQMVVRMVHIQVLQVVCRVQAVTHQLQDKQVQVELGMVVVTEVVGVVVQIQL
jgi:hypothetical protein